MRSMPSSTLHAQVPTASGLTALAHCLRYASFVGLGLVVWLKLFLERSEVMMNFCNFDIVNALSSHLCEET